MPLAWQWGWRDSVQQHPYSEEEEEKEWRKYYSLIIDATCVIALIPAMRKEKNTRPGVDKVKPK